MPSRVFHLLLAIVHTVTALTFSDYHAWMRHTKHSHSQFCGMDHEHLGHMEPLGLQGQALLGVARAAASDWDMEWFLKHHVQGGQPLSVPGGAGHWPAIKRWTDQFYLRSHFGHLLLKCKMRKVFDPENPWPVQVITTMDKFLGEFKLQSTCVLEDIPDKRLARDLGVPLALGSCHHITDKVERTELSFSAGYSSSALQVTRGALILTWLSGRGTVLLAAPNMAEHLSAGHTFSVGVSPINPEAVDLTKFPDVSLAEFQQVEMEPGHILYIPEYWWYQVRSHGNPTSFMSLEVDLMSPSKTLFDPLSSSPGDIIRQAREFTRLRGNQSDDIELPSWCMWVCHVGCQLLDSDNLTILHQKDGKEENLCYAEGGEMHCDTTRHDNISLTDITKTHLTFIPETMRVKELNTGYRMPTFGFGTAVLFEDTYRAVTQALDCGYRMIDTAQGYIGSEGPIGQALRDINIRREEVFIVTKLHPKYFGFDETLKATEESLRKLQTDYIDLYLIHAPACGGWWQCAPGEGKGTWYESWQAMEHLQKQGKVRSLGLSNFPVRDVQWLFRNSATPLAAVQEWFDPFHLNDEMRTFCRQNNIAFMGYSTLGQQWVWGQGIKNPVFHNKYFQELAGRYKVPVASIVLNWALHNDVILIPRSANPTHIRTNLQTLQFKLSAEHLAFIDDSVVNKLEV